nr:MAG TPA: hypothetical protein [Caudoviricetes sp.]
MSSNVEIFKNDQFGSVRIILDESNEPLFCLADVCNVLDLQGSAVVRRLEKDVISSHPLKTNGGDQIFNFVNESGLYDVILGCRKPQTKPFKDWVTKEVLPTIRKTGQYSINKPMTAFELIAAQAQAMVEMEKRMNVMEEKLNFVYEQYQNGQKQLSLLPLSEEPMPEQSLRSQINELVRSYAKMVGADYKDVWIRVYKDLYYRYGVSVNAIKSIKNRETKLEKLERTGNLSKARIVISEMIRMYKSNSIF